MPKSFDFEASNNRVYVTHFCKNKACNRAFLDIDRYNAIEPPRWRYCPECRKKGFGKRKKKNKALSV